MAQLKVILKQRWLLFLVMAVALVTPLVTATLLRGMSEKQVGRIDVVIVAPPRMEKYSDQAAIYDALSRGQVVATAASVFGQSQWTDGYPGIQLSAGSVSPSAVIQIQATGTDADQVRAALTTAVSKASVEVDRLLAPYSAQRLTDGTPHMSSAGLTAPIRGLLTVMATLAATYATVMLGSRFRGEEIRE